MYHFHENHENFLEEGGKKQNKTKQKKPQHFHENQSLEVY